MSDFNTPVKTEQSRNAASQNNASNGSASLTPPAYSLSTADDTYTVQRGETIAVIANKLNVSVEALKAANRVYNFRARSGRIIQGFQSGQRLTIPASNVTTTANEPEIIHYTVQRGETITGLASRYGITQSALMEANKTYTFTLRSGQKTVGFMAGQKIVIPPSATNSISSPTVVPEVSTPTQEVSTPTQQISSTETNQEKTDVPDSSPEVIATTPEKTNAPTQTEQTDDIDVEQFFANYKARADELLSRWYSKYKTYLDRTQLTGDLFENAARNIYNRKGDIKFIVPVEFAFSQVVLEGGASRRERLGQGNVFNVAAYDSGVSEAETAINTLEKGFDSYYSFMADKMLDDKSPGELLQPGHFTKGEGTTGGVYATNPVYEGEIKGMIGKMRLQDSGVRLNGTVGIGAANNAEDVALVGGMLLKAGFIDAGDINDAAKVGQAILNFQRTVLAPQEAQWFIDRKAAVTNPQDQVNVEKKIKGFNDGVVSNRGMTLGAIYFHGEIGTSYGHVIPQQESGPTPTESVQETPTQNAPAQSSPTTQTPPVTTQPQTATHNESTNETNPETVTDSYVDISTTTPPLIVNPISGSVGEGGVNRDSDVRMVQNLLIREGFLESETNGVSNVTGVADGKTIAAIRAAQSAMGTQNGDGRVDPNQRTWNFLKGFSTNTDEVDTSGVTLEQIKSVFPDGVTVALYTHYTNQNNNNKEFQRAITKFVARFKTLGYKGEDNTLGIGNYMAVQSDDDVVRMINSIHAALVSLYQNSDEGKENPNVIPAFLKVKKLALFSHGLSKGVSFNASGSYSLRNDGPREEKRLEQFVDAIRGSLKSDVDVSLYACSTGRETDGTENGDVWHISDAAKQDGDTSFAASLAENLGSGASVYGHLSAGHTVNNYSARVFGADAGKDASVDNSGVHIFDLLYPESYISSEASRLEETVANTRKNMERHYKRLVMFSHSNNFMVDGQRLELGQEMFHDIEGAKILFHNDWEKNNQ